MNQQEIWDAIAEEWSKYRNRIIPEVARFLETKNGKILDMGCGSGRNFISKDKIQLYGVDFSSEMLKHAEQKAKKQKINAILFKSSLAELPFKANFFDAAIYISTLHCIENEEDRKKSLQELFRVLKKGGEAMISVWNIESRKTIKNNVKEGYVYWTKNGKKHRRYYYFYDEKELKKIVEQIGFKILKNSSKINEYSPHQKKNIVFYLRK